MREVPYPDCCGARTITQFGNTDTGFGDHYAKIKAEELDAFLITTIAEMKKKKHTFLTCVMNNDQQPIFHETLIKHGFKCYAKDQWHPKYGNSLSFYLYVEQFGINPEEPQLVPALIEDTL